MRLVDQAGATASKGEVGELLLRGPSVSIGYWGGPDAVKGAPKDGWYQPGDLMRQEIGNLCSWVERKTSSSAVDQTFHRSRSRLF